MPRMELEEDEIELIKERRRKNEANRSWNEALELGLALALTTFGRFGWATPEQQVAYADDLRKEINTHVRVIK